MTPSRSSISPTPSTRMSFGYCNRTGAKCSFALKTSPVSMAGSAPSTTVQASALPASVCEGLYRQTMTLEVHLGRSAIGKKPHCLHRQVSDSCLNRGRETVVLPRCPVPQASRHLPRSARFSRRRPMVRRTALALRHLCHPICRNTSAKASSSPAIPRPISNA